MGMMRNLREEEDKGVKELCFYMTVMLSADVCSVSCILLFEIGV